MSTTVFKHDSTVPALQFALGACPHLILALTSVVNKNWILKITPKKPQQNHHSVLLAERWQKQKHCMSG